MPTTAVQIVVSVDVEEEGLFRGCYPREARGVANVAHLRRLDWVPAEYAVPLTLLVTYPVAAHGPTRDILSQWSERGHAELGAHLHTWCTPPFADGEPHHPEALSAPALADKLASLVAAHRSAFGSAPRAFRMGRFELGPKATALLPRFGFEVDASVMPLRWAHDGPDTFLSPADPFVLGSEDLLEVPVTQVAWSRALARAAYGLARVLPGGRAGLEVFRRVASVGLTPAWTSLASMQAAARLHLRRGGEVLHVFLHSSDLMPGGSPAARDAASVARTVARLRGLLGWLTRTAHVRGVTLSGVAARSPRPGSAPGDAAGVQRGFLNAL
jgi:hypothetical protein